MLLPYGMLADSLTGRQTHNHPCAKQTEQELPSPAVLYGLCSYRCCRRIKFERQAALQGEKCSAVTDASFRSESVDGRPRPTSAPTWSRLGNGRFVMLLERVAVTLPRQQR